jgi:hypothetical protein
MYCDDINNVELCQYDGGDCCGSDVKKEYCDDCQCLDPSKIKKISKQRTSRII